MITWCRTCNENWLQSGYACPCTYRGNMEMMTLTEFFALRARRREFNTVDLKQLREDTASIRAAHRSIVDLEGWKRLIRRMNGFV